MNDETDKDRTENQDAGAEPFELRSNDLLDAVLMANNKWRLEMWCLRLDSTLPDELRPMIAKIMDRQLELEEEAKASNT